MPKNVVKISGAQKGTWQPTNHPKTFTDKYSKEEQAQVGVIIDWVNTHKKTRAWLAATARLRRSTLYLVLSGDYTGTIKRYLKPCLDTIRSLELRGSEDEAPFINSTVAELVQAACVRARRYRSFAVITGEVGTGKTRSLKEYTAKNSNTIIIESDPGMSPTALLEDLCNECHIALPKGHCSKERRFRMVLATLKNTDTLILVDEAETLNPAALHYLRRLRDKAQVGVVLAGTPKLHSLIAPVGGEFDQIRSRVCFWPKTIRAVTPQDAEAVILACFNEIEVDEATIKTLWHYSKGSMRVLTEDLIPAIKDYGLKDHPLTADLVHNIANKVLSLV